MKFEIGKKEIINGVEVVCYDELTEREREVFSNLADLITKTLKIHTCMYFKAYTSKKGTKMYRVEVNGLDCNAMNFAKGPIYSIDDVYMKSFFHYIVSTVSMFNYYELYNELKD